MPDGSSVVDEGSSPLARGLPPQRVVGEPGLGIIPARAGFTWPAPPSPGCSWDHPRSRGVYGCSCRVRRSGPGSFPLARGLRHGRRGRGTAGRIIPARAGFTRGRAARVGAGADHPRSRGVYVHRPRGHLALGGSSPLARGLRLGVSLPSPTMRIIPARAGFTRRPPGRHRAGPDHPRSRGVYARRHAAGDERPGSSPLARGLRAVQLLRGPRTGIIPARAGFTPPPTPMRPGRGDHPRSRGVYPSRERTRRSSSGSSPLARGLHLGVGSGEQDPRIIPARAGFTPD